MIRSQPQIYQLVANRVLPPEEDSQSGSLDCEKSYLELTFLAGFASRVKKTCHALA